MSALFPIFDDAVYRCVAATARHYHVLWPDQAAPRTLAQSIAYWRTHNAVGVSGANSGHTIFGAPAVNHAFRAWHDWHHIRLEADFDHGGEWQVYLAQGADIRAIGLPKADERLCLRVLYCEVIGQLQHEERFGRFPADQRAFTERFMASGGSIIRS